MWLKGWVCTISRRLSRIGHYRKPIGGHSHQKTATKSFSFRTRSSCLAVTSSISGSLSFSLVALAGDGSGVACFLPWTLLTTISSARNDPSHSVLDHRIIAFCRWNFRPSLLSVEFFGKNPLTPHDAQHPYSPHSRNRQKVKRALNGCSAIFFPRVSHWLFGILLNTSSRGIQCSPNLGI